MRCTGANAFALDTRSKRQWESKPIEVEAADKFKQACKDYGFGPDHILPHGSYLINLASADPDLLTKSYNAFVDELKRCEILGIRCCLHNAVGAPMHTVDDSLVVGKPFRSQRIHVPWLGNSTLA